MLGRMLGLGLDAIGLTARAGIKGGLGLTKGLFTGASRAQVTALKPWMATVGGRAGEHVASGIIGAAKGAIPGGILWGATGNASWMPLMMGMGAWRGAGGSMMGVAGKGGSVLDVGRGAGWFNPNRMTRNMAIGTAIGVWRDDPRWAAGGALVGAPAGFMLKTSFAPKGGLGLLKGTLQAPFAPGRAAATLSRVTGVQAGASAGFMGLMAGAGVGAYRTYESSQRDFAPRGDNSVTSGYFPGGVQQLGAGRGPGIGNNHLSSEGLTLALHKNAHKTRVI